MSDASRILFGTKECSLAERELWENFKGKRVTVVKPESAALRAGVRVGSTIIEVCGECVTHIHSFPGETERASLWNPNSTSIWLAERPRNQHRLFSVANFGSQPSISLFEGNFLKDLVLFFSK